MKDLIPLLGDYKQLGWDAPKRGVVLADFVNVIKFSHLVGFGVGVDAEAWRDLRSLYPKLDNVQTFCFARIMRMVIDRMKISATRDQVALHFDSDPEFGAARLRLLSELGKHDPDARTHLGSITFGSMRTILPLQAADLLAWETRKELIQKTGGFSSTGRFSNLFTALGDIQLDYQSELWDRAEIETRALDILGIKRVPATPDAT
jgi:hypothetical protein